MKIRFSLALGTLTLAVCCWVSPAFSNDLGEIQSLLSMHRPEAALAKAEQVIRKNPRDPKAYFLKGIALTDLGRKDEAMRVFQKLTQDYPALPEPYNNLAVLYAQNRQYEDARITLEQALQTHPSYATAYKNLGEIYTHLANQAYGKALERDPKGRAERMTRLALIPDLTPPGSMPATTAVIASTSRYPVSPRTAPVAPPKTERQWPVAESLVLAPRSPSDTPQRPTTPPLAQVDPPKVEEPARTITPIAETQPRPAAPVVETAPQPATPVAEPEPESKPAAATEPPPAKTADDKADVLKTVEAWAAAWAGKKASTYLGFYDKNFAVPGNRSRSAWEEERRQRLNKPGNISVQVQNPRISVKGDRATVQFRQRYSSSNFNATTGKTLELIRRGNQWRILQEKVG